LKFLVWLHVADMLSHVRHPSGQPHFRLKKHLESASVQITFFGTFHDEYVLSVRSCSDITL
jgi:hypothetical protein